MSGRTARRWLRNRWKRRQMAGRSKRFVDAMNKHPELRDELRARIERANHA